VTLLPVAWRGTLPHHAMLQAHSLLWHYLWVGPNIYLLVLAALLWRRGIKKTHPALLLFCVVASVSQLVLYAADILPWVSNEAFWHVLWTEFSIESIIKFILIGEVFVHIFSPYSSIASLGKTFIRVIGVLFAMGGAVAAAITPGPNQHFLVSGPHLLEQTIYLIECGLIFSILGFAAYFRLNSDRMSLGICLGLGISACVHLGTWAFSAHNIPKETSVLLDFLNMTAYNIAVLIWFYYCLVPSKVPVRSAAVALPENGLEVWNRELERLIHQ